MIKISKHQIIKVAFFSIDLERSVSAITQDRLSVLLLWPTSCHLREFDLYDQNVVQI